MVIWRIDLGGGEAIRIARGAAPAISPRGDGVSFIRAGAVELTPGSFAVEYVALSRDRRTIIFNSNQDDLIGAISGASRRRVARQPP
jgi:hypothetical protein